MTPLVVPIRFFDEIALHLASCLMGGDFGSSQLMLIMGPPGGGKTYNLERSLGYLGVEQYTFAADHVESHQANKPIESLDARLSAVRRVIAQGSLSALVMDDADLLLGKYTGVQYTHNLQHLNQRLMEVATGYRQFGPCPIYVCANDASLLHSPLVRLGRARVFEWVPNPDEMLQIVRNLFDYLTPQDAIELVRSFPCETAAFFGRLRQQAMDEYLSGRLRRDGPALWKEAMMVAGGSMKAPTIKAPPGLLKELGKRIQSERRSLDGTENAGVMS